jgi:two-component system, response regulator PdtaR
MADGRINVGIVDDEILVATALKHMLESIGYDVAALAHTVEEGLALAERPGACELVFVDLCLDGEPAGIEVARRAARNGLGVVVVTGGAMLPDELAGAGLLLKPFSTEQVQTLLHALRPRNHALEGSYGADRL